MSQSATSVAFGSPLPAPVDAHFDLGQLTSDGGLLWMREADDELGLCSRLAAEIPEWRRSHIQHSLETLALTIHERPGRVARAGQSGSLGKERDEPVGERSAPARIVMLSRVLGVVNLMPPGQQHITQVPVGNDL